MGQSSASELGWYATESDMKYPDYLKNKLKKMKQALDK